MGGRGGGDLSCRGQKDQDGEVRAGEDEGMEWRGSNFLLQEGKCEKVVRTGSKRGQFQDPQYTKMELREALTGIYTSPLMPDQIPEVWKVFRSIIPELRDRASNHGPFHLTSFTEKC